MKKIRDFWKFINIIALLVSIEFFIKSNFWG